VLQRVLLSSSPASGGDAVALLRDPMRGTLCSRAASLVCGTLCSRAHTSITEW